VARLKVGVLISGRGSNLQALIDACADPAFPAEIVLVLSNKADAYGLERARKAGIPAAVVSHRDYADKPGFEAAMDDALNAAGVELVCLAGFMRLVGAPLLEAFPNAILNVHPSLLPAFPGVDAQRQALAHGVKITGATVHLVTNELDGGPIVLQAAVPVHDGDTVEALSARILDEEHRLYPCAAQMILDGSWHLDGRRCMPGATRRS
jgi:phosphoribosylglycinamide formyltransferase-1